MTKLNAVSENVVASPVTKIITARVLTKTAQAVSNGTAKTLVNFNDLAA